MILRRLLILILFFIFSFSKSLFSEICKTNPKLKVGLIKYDYIDYKYYLYYTLGNYSSEKLVDFELSYVENNPNEFDIIFGEYYELKKYSKNKIKYPKKINDFYSINGIEIKENILPLDLDTFIIVSKNDFQKINFEDLKDFFNPSKYTLGLSFLSKENIIELLLSDMNDNPANIYEIDLESKINNFSLLYKNLNKNIFYDDFSNINNSFDSLENFFTVFSDGVLLYKNFKYKKFQEFPKHKLFWNKDKGLFLENNYKIKSFYGFSAYINNSNKIDFLCYLIDKKVRINTFQNFNIEIGPLSENEVIPIKDKVPLKYFEMLKIKNQNIQEIDYEYQKKIYDIYIDVILGIHKFRDIYKDIDYINN